MLKAQGRSGLCRHTCFSPAFAPMCSDFGPPEPVRHVPCSDRAESPWPVATITSIKLHPPAWMNLELACNKRI
jgi:hypothetical protein